MQRPLKKVCCFSRSTDEPTTEKVITFNGHEQRNAPIKSCVTRWLSSLYTTKSLPDTVELDKHVENGWKGEFLSETFPMSHDYNDMFSLYVLKVREAIGSLKNRQICLLHFDLIVRARNRVIDCFLKQNTLWTGRDLDSLNTLLEVIFAEGVDRIIVNEVFYDIAVTKYENAPNDREKIIASLWLFRLMKQSQIDICFKNRLVKREELEIYALRLVKDVLKTEKDSSIEMSPNRLKVLSLAQFVCPARIAILAELQNFIRQSLALDKVSNLDLQNPDQQSWLYYLISVTNLYLHHSSDEQTIRELIAISSTLINDLTIETQQLIVITLVQQRMCFSGLESEMQNAVKNLSHILLSKTKYFNSEVLSGHE